MWLIILIIKVWAFFAVLGIIVNATGQTDTGGSNGGG